MLLGIFPLEFHSIKDISGEKTEVEPLASFQRKPFIDGLNRGYALSLKQLAPKLNFLIAVLSIIEVWIFMDKQSL